MKVEFNNSDTILTDISDFNLAQTMECGQCFHYQRLDEKAGANDTGCFVSDNVSDYKIFSFGKILHITQEKDVFIFHGTPIKEFEEIWVPYFDLKRDYGKIKNTILKSSPELNDSVCSADGIRILNQEFFETLLSFIISQNNRIPRIRKAVFDISAKWGNEVEGEYLFPEAQDLINATEEDFAGVKTGFRAKYLVDAVSNVLSGNLKAEELKQMDTVECMKRLMSVKGIGPKVANCIMMFSLEKREAFPVDVWIKRIMEKIYFNGEKVPEKEISAFAKEKFKEYGGYAQQYLFAYGRNNI